MPAFLDAIGLDPIPEMISAPRDNPYIFFQSGDVAGSVAEDEEVQNEATVKETK